MKFLSQVIKKHKLDVKEQKLLRGEIDTVLKKINSELSKKRIKAKAVLGGSAAKGTMLRGDFDVDLFVKFDYSYKERNLSDLLEKALKYFKPKRVQGSRDYFQFILKKINYEVVPVLNIKDHKQAVNVTDASPLHVDWVKRYLRKDPKLLDQIILTKVFLKANKLYGAESYIRGFSGHVVDILTINYNGFLTLLKASQEWKPNEVIDPEKHNTAKQLNKSKLGPLIIIDPVQPNRNAASALSFTNFGEFKRIAKEFLKNPCIKFFEKQKITIAELKQKAGKNKLIVLNVTPLKGKEDVVGAKLLKTYKYIEKQLRKNEFTVLEYNWEWDKASKAMFWYILDSEILPMFREHMGPPLHEKQHVKAFEKQYKETYV
ncbi:hypothetical protein A3K72_01995, partial [Candidatus Woesearchaeota archaeon RBG_13_36_6]